MNMSQETPKGVSSRLLTMKFMQRAAASASPKASPASSTPSSSKRRRLDQSPAPGRVNPDINQALIQAALDEQEAARLAVLEKSSAADSHWILNTSVSRPSHHTSSRPFNIQYVGYGDLDSGPDDEAREKPAKGRTSTKPTDQARNEERSPQGNDQTSQSSDDLSDSGAHGGRKRSFEGHLASSERSRSSSRKRSNSEALRAKEFRDKRKKKDVRLNTLTSISSGGDGQMSSHNTKSVKCYNCHQDGHKAASCSERVSKQFGRKS